MNDRYFVMTRLPYVYGFSSSKTRLIQIHIIQKKRISIETRFFTKCISINLYLSSSARYLRYTERLYGQMRRILL